MKVIVTRDAFTQLSPTEKDDRAKAICAALNAYWG